MESVQLPEIPVILFTGGSNTGLFLHAADPAAQARRQIIIAFDTFFFTTVFAPFKNF